jgi:hypothetical protein
VKAGIEIDLGQTHHVFQHRLQWALSALDLHTYRVGRFGANIAGSTSTAAGMVPIDRRRFLKGTTAALAMAAREGEPQSRPEQFASPGRGLGGLKSICSSETIPTRWSSGIWASR